MRMYNRLLILHLVFICSIFISTAAGKTSTLILRNADYNRNSLVNGKLVSVLEGNVEFEYEDAIIYANKTTWHRGSGKAYFKGNIRIVQQNQLLTCDKMDFHRNNKKLIARGNIDFFDKTDQMRIIAQHGVYFLKSKNLILTKDPKMFQYDTTRAETLSISGDKMIYDDSLNIATAENNVLILKGLLKSTCKTAKYYLDTDIAKLRTDPWIHYDIHELTGDSVDLIFIDKVLKGISVMRNAQGYHRDVTPHDTIFTELTGDSLYMAISDSGTIETIWTYEDAHTIYYSSDTPDLLNEGMGKMMVLHFTRGTTGNLTISGNAECVYYVEEKKESGKNEANGDDIFIHFKEGKAVYIKLIGGVRGTYFAERRK